MLKVIKRSLWLTVFICLVTLGSVFSNANIGTENWSYKIGDSPIDSNGNFEWLKEDSNGWQEFNYPKRPPVDGQERLWLKTYIKGNDISNLTLFFATQDQGVEVYIDGKLVSSNRVNSGESINVSKLQKGNYIVTVEDGTNKVSRKIVKK